MEYQQKKSIYYLLGKENANREAVRAMHHVSRNKDRIHPYLILVMFKSDRAI